MSIGLSAVFSSSRNQLIESADTGQKSDENYFFWLGGDRPDFDRSIERSLRYNKTMAISVRLHP